MTILQKNDSPTLQQQIEMTKPIQAEREEEILKKAVMHLNGNILGFIFGVVGALVIFVATNWLVFKGGEVIGPHLGLLSQFFIGYSVTFAGSFIGAVYAFIAGYLSGLFIGWVYNAVILFKNRY